MNVANASSENSAGPSVAHHSHLVSVGELPYINGNILLFVYILDWMCFVYFVFIPRQAILNMRGFHIIKSSSFGFRFSVCFALHLRFILCWYLTIRYCALLVFCCFEAIAHGVAHRYSCMSVCVRWIRNGLYDSIRFDSTRWDIHAHTLYIYSIYIFLYTI